MYFTKTIWRVLIFPFVQINFFFPSSPSGKKFRSKPQLARYLGNAVDLSSFDFRTGKMMPSKLQKNKQRLRNDPLNQNKVGDCTQSIDMRFPSSPDVFPVPLRSPLSEFLSPLQSILKLTSGMYFSVFGSA